MDVQPRGIVGRELVAGAGLSLGAVFALGSTAQAATLEVDNTGDDGSAAMQACTAAANDCSLHGALLVSNASTTVTDTVTFASSLSGSTISLLGQKNIYDAVTISGPGASTLAISGNDTVRVFDINPPTGEPVEISDLTIKDGKSPGTESGGAIRSIDADLTISGSVVTSSSTSDDGGGIFLDDDFNNGFSTLIRNSTISGNSSSQGTGGIHAAGSLGSLVHSTVSGNQALTTTNAGGIVFNGYSYFYSSTIIGNSAVSGVGGIRTYSNPAGIDGLLSNTIVANNTGPAGDDLIDQFDAEFSLVENIDAGGQLNPVSGGQNVIGVEPQLGPLAANGGPTPTHLPAVSSPVVDRGFSTLSTDQRGLPRAFDAPSLANAPGGNSVDMGAVELQSSNFPAPAPPPAAPKAKCPKGKSAVAGKKKKKKKCKKKRKKKK